MYRLFCKSILLLFVTNGLYYAQGLEEKPQKTINSKHKLSKSEPLRAEPVKAEGDFEDGAISVLGITVPPEYANSTIKEDHHTYYNSTFYSDPEVAKQFWVDLEKGPHEVNIHDMLSSSHRQATTIELSFEFPFYGHILKNITIATGGFLYMGDYLHNWIAATQYVAPLMANFDTSQSSNSIIKFVDNGTAFIAQWENVFIQDRLQDGAFTFQVMLLKNGDIVFAYKDIPYAVSQISDARHPVKIGISDAYILERSLFFVRRKTIYEYHRIDMLKRNISNNTALYFIALPTCPGHKDCSSCLAADPKMECNWCEAVKRCSDGIDRARQSWVVNGCASEKTATCAAQSIPTSTVVSDSARGSDVTFSSKAADSTTRVEEKAHNSGPAYNVHFPSGASDNRVEGHAQFVQVKETQSQSGISMGAIVTIVVFIAALVGAAGWVAYAYKFPQTQSGQFLIKYRPSQWSLKPKEEPSVAANARHL